MLTPKQTKLVACLLTGRTVKAACEKAGCSPRAARRWKDDPEFQAAWADARRAAWGEATAALQGLAPAAVRRLRALLASGKENVALRAALGLIDRAAKAVELNDLAERVEALEAGQRRVKR